MEDEIVTVDDYINNLEEAESVLGVSEPDKCTYEKGYLKRQAVFACLTCTQAAQAAKSPQQNGVPAVQPSSTKGLPPAAFAGVCTECAVTCHSDHETVELWTRRNFRCDCGNEKFGKEAKCQLCPNKDPTNDRNLYNQNYGGVYCTCHKPYPDPARDDEYNMDMCVVCEDWFHGEHLGLPDSLQIPEASNEIICPQCVADKCKFLLLYPHLLVPPDPVRPPEEEPAETAALLARDDAEEERSKGEGVQGERPLESAVAATADKQGSKPEAAECLEGGGATGQEEDPLVRALAGGSQYLSRASPETASDAAAISALDSTGAPLVRPGTDACGAARGEGEGAGDCDNGKCRIKEQCGGSSLHNMLKKLEQPLSGFSKTEGTEEGAVASGALEGAEAPASQSTAERQTEAGCEEQAAPPLVAEWRGELADKLPGPSVWQPGWATFFADGWRSKLCTCTECKNHYASQGVPFLSDESDTIRAYEEESRRFRDARSQEADAQLAQAVQGLGHVGQLELAHGIQEFKTHMASFMMQFQGTDHVIQASDVHNYFDELKRKRRRL